MASTEKTDGLTTAAYDVVGEYSQDEINGFDDALLDDVVSLIEPRPGLRVLDFMGGDGNLSRRIASYCQRRDIGLPQLTLFELSRVQCEIARAEDDTGELNIICGNALTLCDREGRPAVEEGSFDCILIKSGNHEIPREKQLDLYRSAYRALAPGGLFVNLGFLYDDPAERDEIREIARCKDRLAGMIEAVENRYFVTREELYGWLTEAGFEDIQAGRRIEYAIRSEVVDENYFRPKGLTGAHEAFIETQLGAIAMQRSGRLTFSEGRSVMRCPGEVTIARKPGAPGGGGDEVARAIADACLEGAGSGARILEVGEGLLPPLEGGALRSMSAAGFDAQAFEPREFDRIALLFDHQGGCRGLGRRLTRAFDALRPGGEVIVAGYPDRGRRDAALAGRPASAARAAGVLSLSVEGLAMMLRHSGFEAELEMRGLDGERVLLAKARRPVALGRTGPMTTVEELFQRSLCAHLPASDWARLQRCRVLVAGLGGGSNIAELLARKGIGRMTIADLDVYESHNIRQRGSTAEGLGEEKVAVMHRRLLAINPSLDVRPVCEGVSMANVEALVEESDLIVDMLDFSAFAEKIALHRAARARGKVVLTAPSVVNGAVLYVFTPQGPDFEAFFGLDASLPAAENGERFLDRLIPSAPPEAPMDLYRQAARGERTLPLDAVGVDQAAVMVAAAVENLILGRLERVIFVPRGLQVDVSDPCRLAQVVDFGGAA